MPKLCPDEGDAIPKIFVVIGPPGTGKTTYLSERATEGARKFGSRKVLIASLTRTAAAEVASRHIPLPKEQVGTLHSHAYGALGHPKIIEKKHLEEWNDFATWMIQRTNLSIDSQKFHLTSMGTTRSDVDEPKDVSMNRRAGEDILQECWLRRSRCIPLDMWGDYELESFERIWREWKKKTKLWDFEDLIERASEDTHHGPNKPVVIYLDEAQDLSKSEFKLVMKWAIQAHSVVTVSDPDQSIYSWRGASPDTILWLASHHPSRKDAPRESYRKILEQSYRVPRRVHAYATGWINESHNREPVPYKARDAEGNVYFRPNDSITSEYNIHWILEKFHDAKSIMFLTSCDYMLHGLIRYFKSHGIPFHNPFRTKRGDWNPLRAKGRILNFLRPDENTWGNDARIWNWEEFHNWLEIIDGDYLVRGARSSVKQFAYDEELKHTPIGINLEDAIDTIKNAFRSKDMFIYRDLDRLRRLLKRTQEEKNNEVSFTNLDKKYAYTFKIIEQFGGSKLLEEPKIILGTVHSVKGAEADVVVVSSELSPEGNRVWEDGRGKESNDVRKLFYVAFTRARESLVLVGTNRRKERFAVNFKSPEAYGISQSY